ncbi:MAG TPA: protein-methionine-sulfoxide reductase heme-binding subunit MsrQ [Tepidisphaeraceae bacterium]|nr:protein-methionine-sulfoxide reductase heme-binding subunit MsrQ [Tepidisphaeraceae bacterium]
MKDSEFAKFVLLVNGVTPLALLGWDAINNHLGADPIEFALLTTGMLTLIFVLLTLCVTPARKILHFNFLSNFRRMLGLLAFFYGSLHFLIYFVCYQSFSVRATVQDTIKRPFILFGMTCLILMAPLAITSTQGMIRRLGAANWKRLHWLIYPAAAAAVTHFWLYEKADTRKPRAFATVLAVLLLYRIVAMVRKNLKLATPTYAK